MQTSWLLPSQQSIRDVTKRNALAGVGVAKSFQIHNWRYRNQRLSSRIELSIATTRHISSIRPNSNHLHDVKEYTAVNPVTIWQSTSNNPYENLAIENYLLKNSDAASKILFTYVNWPCVVIGRNQNPWLECNLARMQKGLPHHALFENEIRSSTDKEPIPLALVRRRSGGGTVIHDAGNLNFSFIVPNDKDFTRDTHGELVAKMLQGLRSRHDMKPYYSSVRVNERHDIVMRTRNKSSDTSDKEFKVSGSAFKLTRGRALHHGTILHSSPNIREQKGKGDERGVFSEVLSSPAKPFLDAKGVGSVRSPVHNLFEATCQSDRLRYNREIRFELHRTFQHANDVGDVEIQTVGASDCKAESNRQIFDDIQELLTKEWQFCQTPSFEYTSSHEANDVHIHFQVKHGIIGIPTVKHANGDSVEGYESLLRLQGQKLHEIKDWSGIIPSSSPSSNSIVSHLAIVFPNVDIAPREPSGPMKTDTMRILEFEEILRDGDVVEKRSTDGRVETEKEGESLVVER